MNDDLAGVRAFLVANEGVDSASTEPWDAVRRGGGAAVLVAPDGDDVRCHRHLDRADVEPVDGTLVSSRKPDDLPTFCREIVHAFAGARAS